MSRILHIAKDEKFIDMGLNMFESVSSGNNDLLILSNRDSLFYVKSKPHKIISQKQLIKEAKEEGFWSDYRLVVIHSLFCSGFNIPSGIKVIWIGFGYDYYDLIGDYTSFLSEKTKEVYINQKKLNSSIISKVKNFKIIKHFRMLKKIRMIERVDYFCPVLDVEYDLINWAKIKKPKLMDWNYGTYEDNWSVGSVTASGDKILIGNSADITCNHFDAIDLVSRLGMKNELVFPLSYGCSKYAQLVEDYVNENYQGNANFLKEFLPINEYFSILEECAYVIMPHKRQQGLGNIFIALSIGAKVFLDKENPIYTFLTSHNVHVFEIGELEKDSWKSRLTKDEIEENITFLKAYIGRDSMEVKTKALIDARKLIE
ncbi:TDP-N-acetylfucosamine:lipid II N-acetylfucosaminyltransferase [Vibrio alginolyticus]|uniref:TDP-N-acetylfucosamine:lipid II N-acetylfucosaminyltransferase n=1 Tax=Vibrio TaxID=662 RepID=UPI00148D1B94|nr:MULTISPECIES: TDP-N-acetylfucosamine:lipid II N-acetylfucosaminyltransferase [Vibrio]MCQ9103295.1 TDP-N-acetylfucosamine:lipid II N-acetylfucosaminyltransferase [Vibrio alginolyticus]MDW2263280.1 TDP-N-acetylfucosamine:lipid II N-acetylfucosaminyltransferase [Vibrio sp. 1557]NOI43116.1 hypothetical protein [Vibrio alginolyticus]HBC3489959.1 TDP-N-acetylfucosamine:lipid II N-acetylfucosaminyltransferase [Vibrio alginolyticus]